MKKFLSLILVAIMLVTAMPMAFAEGNTYKVGDIIQFGSYPQSEVKDETLIAELNALAPEWEKWTSYGYYSGDGTIGSMVQGDWMRYIDIEFNGEKYRGVKFTQYRPYSTLRAASLSNTYQDDNGYFTDIVYWFKFEAIKWRVFDPKIGLVICEIIIDSQPYSNIVYHDENYTDERYSEFNDLSYKNYANDYETSSIRLWINDNFYKQAFTEREKDEITTTILNNDGYYTSIGVSGYEKFDSNATQDKIFLLSYKESNSSNFGFVYDSGEGVVDRATVGSDYAKIQGLYVSKRGAYVGNSYWLLRSPGSFSHSCCNVLAGGDQRGSCSVNESDNGVRPALVFKDISSFCNEHIYSEIYRDNPTCFSEGSVIYKCTKCLNENEVILPKSDCNFIFYLVAKYPTCTEEGEMAYFCEYCETKDETSVVKIDKLPHNFKNGWQILTVPTCANMGASIRICNSCLLTESKTEDKLTHKDDNGDYKCDYGCGYEFEKSVIDECSCICHKGGIAGIIWNFINFFYRIFKINGECSCGAVHY